MKVNHFCQRIQHEAGNYFVKAKPRSNKWFRSRFNSTVYEATFGYITKKARLKLNLSKKHSHDACAIVESNKLVGNEYQIKPRRTKVWEANPTKTCTERNGLRHYDLVKSSHRKRGIVVGSVRSLKANCITLRTKWDDNFPVSYSKTRLLQRFGGLVYSF